MEFMVCVKMERCPDLVCADKQSQIIILPPLLNNFRIPNYFIGVLIPNLKEDVLFLKSINVKATDC